MSCILFHSHSPHPFFKLECFPYLGFDIIYKCYFKYACAYACINYQRNLSNLKLSSLMNLTSSSVSHTICRLPINNYRSLPSSQLPLSSRSLNPLREPGLAVCSFGQMAESKRHSINLAIACEKSIQNSLPKGLEYCQNYFLPIIDSTNFYKCSPFK